MDIDEARRELPQWVHEICGERIHGTTRLKPRIVFEEEERSGKRRRCIPQNPYTRACQKKTRWNFLYACRRTLGPLLGLSQQRHGLAVLLGLWHGDESNDSVVLGHRPSHLVERHAEELAPEVDLVQASIGKLPVQGILKSRRIFGVDHRGMCQRV